ncbi:unnamed protein product [Prorocentrum cordatum]|uniref:Reverse transcriptase domain-containing protein n=1 Tax=Prorocentrum cordatum TaxID=2364126 RepID=A0ABN9U2K6_9DINO|nr:unnamed protein product [Polarella glacialis]
MVRRIKREIALLHLRGPAGALDLVTVYLPTGTRAISERIAMLQRLGLHLQDRQKVPAIIAGVFNYVVAERHCVNKDAGAFRGDGDLLDESAFQEKPAMQHGLQDMYQAHFTCDSSQARPRIDRIYTNMHLVDQLHRHCSSAALQWCENLSCHRHLAFSRRRSARRSGSTIPLPTAPMDDPDWLPRARREYAALLAADQRAMQPLGRLLLMKEAMRQVTTTMNAMSQAAAAVTTEDKLGWAMSFLRAADEVNLPRTSARAQAHALLAALADAGNPTLRTSSDTRVLREHIVELARQDITDDLAALQADTSTEYQHHKARPKENILVKLRRLLPGTCTGLNAMADEDGASTADPAEIAGIMRKHWAEVFSRKTIDRTLLSSWLEDTFRRGERGRVASGLRDTSSPSCQVRRRGVHRAMKLSGNGAPGPGGTPYKAWRKVGDLGVEILFEAVLDLAKPDAAARLRSAYGAEEHDFNLSLLSCPPKKRSRVHEELGDYCLASATGPLTIGNADNRLVANAARLRWEPIFNEWVSKVQRGFLRGRSMLANIVDIDFEAMRISLTRPSGALVFFDFKAAFPSEDREYLSLADDIGAALEDFLKDAGVMDRIFPEFASISGLHLLGLLRRARKTARFVVEGAR